MRAWLLVPTLALVSVGCADPVADAEIAALPGEVPGIRPGPEHRAGQPCTLCHSDEGGRNPTFSVAGTLFQKPSEATTTKVPIEGAVIQVTDATGALRRLVTNCVGNFFVEESDWQPVFPLFVNLTNAATGSNFDMTTKIGRSSSCATCHEDPAGTDSPGHIYLMSDLTAPDMPVPPLDCDQPIQ
jgi:hypothetical protein